MLALMEDWSYSLTHYQAIEDLPLKRWYAYPWSVSDEFLPKTVSIIVAAADASSTSNFLRPPTNNTIEEELAQLRRRLEEKEAEVANLTDRKSVV